MANRQGGRKAAKQHENPMTNLDGQTPLPARDALARLEEVVSKHGIIDTLTVTDVGTGRSQGCNAGTGHRPAMVMLEAMIAAGRASRLVTVMVALAG